MKRKQKSWMLTTVIACGCVAIGITGGALAYLSYADGKNNTFTVGQVKIQMGEPGYPAADSDGDGVPDDNTRLTPYVCCNLKVPKNGIKIPCFWKGNSLEMERTH